VGLAHLASRSAQSRRLRSAVGPLLLGAVVVTPLTLAIAYVAHRYVVDFVPLLLVAGALGVQVLMARGRTALLVLCPLALLGALTCWVNFSLALAYQRTFSPTALPSQRAELVRWQERVDDLLPGNQAPLVRSVAPDDPLPGLAEEGTLAVVGRCRALLQWDGAQWRELEVGNGGGHFRLHLVLPDTPVGEAVPVLTGPTGGTLSVERRPRDRVRFRFDWHGRPPTIGAEVAAGRPGRERLVEARIDRRLHSVEIRLDGDTVLGVLQYSAPADDLAPAPDYPGDLRNEPPSTATCRSVLSGS
jgi:hypothetical protein